MKQYEKLEVELHAFLSFEAIYRPVRIVSLRLNQTNTVERGPTHIVYYTGWAPNILVKTTFGVPAT